MEKKKIKKSISSVIVVMVAIIMFSLNVFSASVFHKDKGYYEDFSTIVNILGINTKVGNLKKSFPEKMYSTVKINEVSPKQNYVYMWVMNDEKKWVSDKTMIPTDGKEHKIKYSKDITFVKNGNVNLWCENISRDTLLVKSRFYAY